MEVVIVKQEEEDWACNVDGTVTEFEVKTELDLGVALQSASASTVPTLLNDSPIKQEPTDSSEEDVITQESSTLCNQIVCDSVAIKVEDSVTDAAVKENDEWLQRLTKARINLEKSLQHNVRNDVIDKYGKDETAVAYNNSVLKLSIPVNVGNRKFVLVPHTTRNVQPAATNTQHKDPGRSQLPAIAKSIMKVLEDREQPSMNTKIMSNPSYCTAQPPVAKNVATSIPQPVLLISTKQNITPVLSKIFITAKPHLLTKHVQSPPERRRSHVVKRYSGMPDCIFQPKPTKKKASVATETNLKPVPNNVLQRSVTINRILEQSVSKELITPSIITKKNTPLVTNERLNPQAVDNTSPLVSSSYENSPVVSKFSPQAKAPRPITQSQKLLNILDTLKASKRAEAFKKVALPVRTNHCKSPAVNDTPLPQKTMKINPKSEIVAYLNSRLPHPIETKSIRPIRFNNSSPTSQLEDFLRPCFVILDRLKPLTCVVCRQQFYLKSQFVQHVFQHVKNGSAVPQNPCKICGKYFQRKYLKIHERKEHGPKNFWCDHCGKKCSDKVSLIKHLIIHSDKKLFRCDVCNKTFRSKSNLVSHQRMHLFETPYTCVICDKRFRRKTNLSTHSLYHLATRPHQCKICDKQFRQLFHLERHMLVHTAERPFPCEICNMRFTRNCHRKRHMAVHTSTKKLACDAKKSLKKPARLKKHKPTCS